MRIGIVNAGIGNIASVKRMLDVVGLHSGYVMSGSECADFEAFILPGVGHFDVGMRALDARGFTNPLRDHVLNNRAPILGICLGMQLLCRSSEEGSEIGLGLVDASVKKFRFPAEAKLKVPHVGWSVVHPTRSNPLIFNEEEAQRFYFVHSYRVVPDDASVVIGTANYGDEFCAAFQKGHIFGVQFHPEKSHRFGMALLKRFVDYRAC